MADSRVILEVIAEGKNLKVVQRQVEELGTSVNKTADAQNKQEKQLRKNKKATKELTSEERNYNRGQKGVANATANSTKSFSKQRDAIGSGSSGLVGAYATLAANLFAATALFGALRSAAQVETLIAGAEALGAASGRNIPLLAESLKEATGNAISLDQALRTASFATSSGFNTQQIEQLSEVGKKAAIALGRDVGDAVDRLTRGVAKLEPEILDELGIIVRLDDATESYAAQLGKTVNQLTAFERQQAFANATIEQGLDKFSNIDTDPNPYDQLASSLRDLANAGLALANNVLGPLVGFFAENKAALLGLIIVLTRGIVNQALPVFSEFAQRAKNAADVVAKEAVKSAKDQRKQFVESKKTLMGVGKELGDIDDKYKRMFSYVKTYDGLIKKEKDLTAEINKRVGALKRTKNAELIKVRTAELDRLKDAQKRVNAEISKAKAPDLSPETANKLKAIADSKAALFESLDDDPSIDNFKKKFKEARNVGEDYAMTMKDAGKFQLKFLTNLPLIGGRLGFVNKAFVSGSVFIARWGTAAQVALRGITFAIPIIGQIILALSLLASAAKAVFNKFSDLLPQQSKLSKTSEALEANISTLASSTKAYEKTLVDLAIETSRLQEVRGQFLDETERELLTSKLRQKELRAEITLIVAQGTAIQESLSNYKKYREELALVRAESGILTNFLRSVGQFFSNQAAIFARFGKAVSLTFRKLIIDSQSFIVSLVDAFGPLGEEVAQAFGIGKAQLEASRREAELFEEQLARTFALDDAERLIYLLDNQLANLFINTIEGSQEAGKALSEKLFGKGAEVDAERITNTIQSIFENVNAASVSEEVRQLALEYADLNGAISEQESRQRFIAELLEMGTKELVAQATSIQTIESAVDGSTEALSNYVTSLSKGTTSVSAILEQTEKLTAEIKKGRLEGEKLEELLKDLPQSFKGILQAIEGANGSLADGLIIYENMLKTIQLIELSEKRTKATIQSKLSLLKKLAKDNRAALQQNIQGELELIKLSKKKIDNEIKLRELAVQAKKAEFEKARIDDPGLEKPAALLQLEQGLADLKAEQASLVSQDLQTRAEIYNVSLMSLDIAKEEYALSQQQAEIDEQRLTIGQKFANALSGRGFELTPAQEIEAIERASNRAIEAAEYEVEMAESRLAIEKLILEAKLKATEAQIRAFNADPANKENQIANIDITGILAEFDSATERTLEGLRKNVEKAKEDKRLNLLSAVFGGMDGLEVENPAAAMVDNMEASIARLKVVLTELEGNKDSTPFDTIKASVLAVNDSVSPMIENLKSLGPDGVLVAAITEGAFAITNAFATIADSTQSTANRIAAVGAAIQAIGQIQQASSQAAIAAIDQEIAAEKKRDGKSKESLAKISALEAKKEKEKRKAFEMNKKMQMAQVAIAVAASIASNVAAASAAAISAGVAAPAVFSGVLGMMNAVTLALGAAQLAIISGTSYQGGGSVGGASSAPSMPTIEVGQRRSSVDLATSQGAAGELAYFRGAKGTGGPENFTPAFMGAKYRNEGGPTAGYTVGEQGPELFVPSVPGTIVPNDEIQQTPQNVNISINAIDSQGVEQVLVEQRGNIIGMIRDAANNIGEDFYEEIETAVYTPSSAGARLY